jgi:outer membrane cobalamin receptor
MSRISFILALFLLQARLFAQVDSSAKSMDEVVITASKFPQTKRTGKIITVITQDQLQKNAGHTIGET